jgi:hypothetical protein
MLDALAREAKSRTQSLLEDPNGNVSTIDASNMDAPDGQIDPFSTGYQEVEVNDVLELIPDHRKRLAFRLFMDGIPCKSRRGESIERAVGLSERTVREWIREVQEILKQHMGDVS